MGDLTRNFSRWEFMCRDCGKSWPGDRLVDGLQDLRSSTGRRIDITCGCRCRSENRRVGGAAGSRHVIGDGADIAIDGMTVREMYGAACEIAVFAKGGIGLYPQEGFIHVDARGCKARWGRLWDIDENGKRANPHYVGLRTVLKWMRESEDDND